VGLMELLSKGATVAMVSFVVSSMLAMGAALPAGAGTCDRTAQYCGCTRGREPKL
jgi:hypothetical protein